MKKEASVLIESLIVFFVLLFFIFVALPFLRHENQNEKNIVIWEQKYSNIKYAYDVLKIITEDKNTNLSTEFQNNLQKLLREKNAVTSAYHPSFMNKRISNKVYTFDKFFENENGLVIGFKWINPKCIGDQICAVMSVDVNGLKNPNVWGKDIFGVNFYRDDVKTIGYDMSISQLKKDCSKSGSGITCSTYYLKGGSIGK